jgi:hypothetical protein
MLETLITSADILNAYNEMLKLENIKSNGYYILKDNKNN